LKAGSLRNDSCAASHRRFGPARHAGTGMSKGVITLFYGVVLLAASLMLGAMAVVEYRGFLLPSQLLVSLAGFVACDQLLQFCIRRGFIG